jgi:zinc protease
MSDPPTLPPPRTFVAQAPVAWKLKNGLEVVLLEKHTAPLVGIILTVKTGASADPAGKGGTALLTADLLDEGAGGRSALETAQATERLGAHLFTAADLESSQVGLSVLSSRLPAASALLADVVLRPNFDAKDFERVKGEHLASLIQRRVEPRQTAQLALAAALYGDTPYGRSPAGYLDTVQGIGLPDVRAFYGAYFRPGNAVLVVVGDTTEPDLRARVEKLFGEWKPRPVRAVEPPRPPAHRPRLVLIDKPGAPQSVVRVGEPTLARRAPEFPALETLTTVLGGSFTSRLERNLRERNNFSYTAGAILAWRRGPALLSAQADVFTDVTAPALGELLQELSGMLGPITPEELEKARALERQGLVSQMQSSLGVCGLVSELVVHDLPADEYRRLDERLSRLTLADLGRVARRYIHPKTATIVVVGDLTKIRPAIERLGLGAVELRDADGRRL